ncbi:hypothetical protein KPH14_012176 [Odynerus spinipes]|uniref:Uncharacterized protein n=1 Tax=Odynerus spinipes TaxID=1348599 RepID=A0AAD9VM93_9HYME|nr:hypothetical protein KPH14_012176 [Odynerus spinipes]
MNGTETTETERDRRRESRNRKAEIIHTLSEFLDRYTPLELIKMMDRLGLATNNSERTLRDRFTRYHLREQLGENAAIWRPEVDERGDVPETTQVFLAEPSFSGPPLPRPLPRTRMPSVPLASPEASATTGAIV